ncbi:tryptophan--tRNA ligase [Candidatus Uhrbacteria bacterium]|nr:tryptophan--tRNA ligase [Candidatus Uhrbacteria bacterium]
MSKHDILVTGIQPTGPLHIGNYIGAVKNMLRLQDEYSGRMFVFVADYHSITADYNPKEKQAQVLLLASELLALGINPKKVVLYVQSKVPEVTELAWIFNTVTPISFLERMTQFKDKSERQKENINVGLFDYPVLQAADILVMKGMAVPVGADQVQHVELTRDVARFFNRRFSETFFEPKPLLAEVPRVMSLIDPTKKMSKSVSGSFISLADEPAEIRNKLRGAVTDLGPKTDGMSAGVKNLFTLLKEFGSGADVKKMESAYSGGALKYVELKDLIAERIAEHFADFRKQRAQLLKNPTKIKKILREGAERARQIAKKTMDEVLKKTGLR